MEDEVLTVEFDRLVQLSRTTAPSMSDLEGRVVARHRRRQNRQRAVFAACAVLLVALGLAAVLIRPSSDDGGDRLGSKPAPTTVPVDPAADPVFTIARLPEDLAFRSCVPGALDAASKLPVDVTCTYDDPATAAADGLRITRVVGGATPALVAAWDDGDAVAAVRESGGFESPELARFTTMSSTPVLVLAPGGRPSDIRSAALRILVGDDLVDIGATGVPIEELSKVVTGMSMAPPSLVVSQALGALPEGSTAMVQGERPLWVQIDPLRPDGRTRFGGDTVGTEIAVPGSPQLIGVDVTTGIDADSFLDGLLATGDAAFSATEIAGRRAVVLAPGGMMPLSVPEPRPGPQALVRLADDVVVRVKDPDGSAEQVEAIAEALQ